MSRKFLMIGTAAIAMSAYAMPTSAQDVSGDEEAESRQQTIVITGRKKAETLLEAPISVSAFSAETLQDFGALSARDVADLTPGLQINGDFGRTGERPVIRGISNLRAETPQPVGLFIDGVYVRSGLISEILDNVERVEVLKGPQGALYGRSTYGGVINYISKTPDQFEADLSATYAEHDQYEVTGRIAGPLADGLSAAIGGRYYTYGGEYDNVSANTAGARDVGEEQTTAVYGSLNFQPSQTPELEINLRGYYSKDEDGQFAGQLFDSTFNNSVAAGGTACPEVIRSYFCGEASTPDNVDISTSADQGQIVSPFFGGIPAAWDFRAGLDREITRVTGDASYDFSENLTLTYMVGLTQEDTHNVVNQSYSPTIVGNSFGSFPSAWVTDDMADRTYWSQELRLNGSIGSSLDWILGVFVYDEENEGRDRNILEANYAFDGSSENEETAVYGAIDFALTDAFSIGLEGRAYEEDVSVTTVSGVDLSESFDGFTWRATAEYQFPNDVLIYGNVSTGNKAGGFNTGVDPSNPAEAPFVSFDEELATQYEIGAKGQFMDNRLRLSGALYRIELEDQQISQVVILNEGTPDQVQVTVVLNAGATEINGFEVDGQFDVTENFTIGGAWSTSDGEFTEGSDPTQATILPSDTLVGFSVPRVSKNSGIVSGTYTFEDFAGWQPSVRVDGLYASSRYAQVQNLIETGDSFKANARLTFTNEEHGLEASFWGRNIGDDDTPANVFRYVDPGDFRFFARAHVSFLPRGSQYGVTVRKSF
ncbi:MAG: TonB-dependent receptor [Pseudomonadota bacterium]